MMIRSDRFGIVEVDDGDTIRFPAGIIGFPGEHRFVLLRQRRSSVVGWLQSTTTSWLAVPVVSLDALDLRGAQFDFVSIAAHAGISAEVASLSVMAVLHAAAGAPATVNLLAPVVVDVDRRVGAQVLIEGSKLSTQEPFVLQRDLAAQPPASPHPAPHGPSTAAAAATAR